MLKDFPIYFDDKEIMQWSKWEESHEVVENTYATEAGTDQVDVVRYDKLSVSCQFRCHSEWLANFSDFAKKNIIQVKLYDSALQDYTTRKMRMRDFKTVPIEHSEKMKDTNGVWDVSFVLKEF